MQYNNYQDFDHNQRIENAVRNIQYGFKVLIVVRGLPGSGKTYLANRIVNTSLIHTDHYNTHILNVDNYFAKHNNYVYDWRKLNEAQCWNQARLARAADKGVSPIIVDDLNINVWDMRPYAMIAANYGYIFEIVEPHTWWKFNEKELITRTKYNVSILLIQNMIRSYDLNVTAEMLFDKYQITYQFMRPPLYRNYPPLMATAAAVVVAATSDSNNDNIYNSDLAEQQQCDLYNISDVNSSKNSMMMENQHHYHQQHSSSNELMRAEAADISIINDDNNDSTNNEEENANDPISQSNTESLSTEDNNNSGGYSENTNNIPSMNPFDKSLPAHLYDYPEEEDVASNSSMICYNADDHTSIDHIELINDHDILLISQNDNELLSASSPAPDDDAGRGDLASNYLIANDNQDDNDNNNNTQDVADIAADGADIAAVAGPSNNNNNIINNNFKVDYFADDFAAAAEQQIPKIISHYYQNSNNYHQPMELGERPMSITYLNDRINDHTDKAQLLYKRASEYSESNNLKLSDYYNGLAEKEDEYVQKYAALLDLEHLKLLDDNNVSGDNVDNCHI